MWRDLKSHGAVWWELKIQSLLETGSEVRTSPVCLFGCLFISV